MKAEDIVEAIKRDYSDSQQYVVMEQVANGTGYRCNSWIDVAVVSLWPSAGFRREAYEVKVSKADFRKEANDVTKNAWVRKRFHFFWYICPKGVIDVAEVPDGAGLQHINEDGKRIIVRQAPQNPHPELCDEFYAASLRAARKAGSGILAEQQRKSDQARFAEVCRQALLEYTKANNAYINEVSDKDLIITILNKILTGEGASKQLSSINHINIQLLTKLNDLMMLLLPAAVAADELLKEGIYFHNSAFPSAVKKVRADKALLKSLNGLYSLIRKTRADKD